MVNTKFNQVERDHNGHIPQCFVLQEICSERRPLHCGNEFPKIMTAMNKTEQFYKITSNCRHFKICGSQPAWHDHMSTKGIRQARNCVHLPSYRNTKQNAFFVNLLRDGIAGS